MDVFHIPNVFGGMKIFGGLVGFSKTCDMVGIQQHGYLVLYGEMEI